MRGAPFGVPTLWAVGCLAVLAMATMNVIAASAIAHNAYRFAKHYLQNTYVVVPHFDFVIWQAAELVAVFGFFAGWYHLFPKIAGYSYSERLARTHFWLSIAGVGALNLMEIILTAQLLLFDPDADMLRYSNLVSPFGAGVFAAGLVVFFVNMVLSFVRRRSAP